MPFTVEKAVGIESARIKKTSLRGHEMFSRDFSIFKMSLLALLVASVIGLILGIFSQRPYVITAFGFITFIIAYSLSLSILGDKYLKYTLLLPSILILLAVSIFPFIYALRASLFDVSAINLLKTWNFVGLRNYKSLFSDRIFWNALLLTLEYLLFAVAVEYLLGLALALLFNQLPDPFLSVFLIPMMMTPIAAGLMWKSMFNIDNGFINLFLKSFDLEGFPWLTYQALPIFNFLPQAFIIFLEKINFTYGLFTILVVDIWQWTPLMCLFLLTGIRSLPVEALELARIDGATSWQVLRYVILPLLRPLIVVAILIRMIDIFKVYDTIYALYGTGVGVRTLNIHLTTYIFRTHDYGQGSALSIIVLILVSTIVPIFYNLGIREKKI